MKRRTASSLFSIGLVLSFLSFLSFLACEQEPHPASLPIPVTVIQVGDGTGDAKRRYSANVVPYELVRVSAQVSR